GRVGWEGGNGFKPPQPAPGSGTHPDRYEGVQPGPRRGVSCQPRPAQRSDGRPLADGARTGQARTVVLGYGRQGDRYVGIASAHAAPADPAWYRNPQETPLATGEDGAERSAGRASTATSGAAQSS